ncbi:hypothetical protein CWI39_2889p0010 [Hamiltosporidium magnivora]|uniref:Uncharacterized protein n=1 Tax=Hamiltosporidium magnivora TaxID=148818 RepID=A0A4Q9KS00_9MICR|nr:hypothetical protein CWI39_2889p0010 [Hamiltosporidium magnivora]
MFIKRVLLYLTSKKFSTFCKISLSYTNSHLYNENVMCDIVPTKMQTMTCTTISQTNNTQIFIPMVIVPSLRISSNYWIFFYFKLGNFLHLVIQRLL